MSSKLERNRCDGCGRFHQDLSYDEDSGLSICDDCITKKYGPPPTPPTPPAR